MRDNNLINSLTFRQIEKEDVENIVNLWNEEIYQKEIYAEFSVEDFTWRFLNNPSYKKEGTVIVYNKDELVGCGVACFHKDSNPETSCGFITLLFVKEKYRRHGLGSEILGRLEKYILDSGRTVIRNYFGAPMNLKWYVPGYDKHEHAGAPAVPFNTSYYFLLLANGYNVNGQHDGFHVNLENFEMDEKVLDKIKENEKDGYTITYYYKDKHHGFDEMFDALQNEGFRNAVHNVLAKPNPDPLLIVQKDGEILGFTGPVRTEPSGRAYLAGVAIHPKAQKRGLGKTMFCELCRRSKENGAKFMTLFTGSDNRARNIYLYAGLRIVQSFVVMKKELVK